MTPVSVRPFASREAITGDSRGIRRRQRRRFYTPPRSPSRRYGCCSEATLTRQPKRALLIGSSQIGTGRISASQLTIRPTGRPSKNPVNSVAGYRQTVLDAFQQVEDNLVVLRVLSTELTHQQQATSAAEESLKLFQNRYAGGAHTDV